LIEDDEAAFLSAHYISITSPLSSSGRSKAEAHQGKGQRNRVIHYSSLNSNQDLHFVSKTL
jgi:hypothetical protein